MKGLTWEEETRARIERAKAEQRKAEEVSQHAQRVVQHWASRVAALENALQLELVGLTVTKQQPNLASMSVNNALIELAKENGGVVVTKQVIGWFVKAGVFSTRGDANDNIHSTLRRSKNFRKDEKRKGVYHLVAGDGWNEPPAHNAPVNGNKPHLADVVGLFIAEHPEWGHKDLVEAVKQTGYDFQGKRPDQAVNMARTRLRTGKSITIHTQMTLPSQLT